MNTILFDLDGTLLPMDQDVFIKAYFNALAKKFTPLGIEEKELIKGVWAGTEAMVCNDGSMTNEKVFWQTFENVIGPRVRDLGGEFEAFYLNDFEKVRHATVPTPFAARCIKKLKEKGYDLVLATNPVFPRAATLARTRWAGLDANDFIHITSYENCSYCKPSIGYYEEILKKIGKKADECMMIGNDVKEDMAAIKLGMQGLLLSDYVIGEADIDCGGYRSCSFVELVELAEQFAAAV